MRTSFHEDLDKISVQLVEMSRLAGSAMARATTALLDADLHLAESVIAADEQIDELRRELDDLAIDLLARQQPVATDLRMVVTAMKMGSDIERMGDLARHVAKVARLRYPKSAIHPVMRSTILEMGQVAERIVAKAGSVIAGKDIESALALERDDDEMDRLHRDIFNLLLDGKWTHGTEAAVDATLVGRYYERYADHAVSVARRVIYLVTGEYRADTEPLIQHYRDVPALRHLRHFLQVCAQGTPWTGKLKCACNFNFPVGIPKTSCRLQVFCNFHPSSWCLGPNLQDHGSSSAIQSTP